MLQEETLALRKEGIGVVLDSELPHLIGIDDDLLSTGIILYHLKVSAPGLTFRLVIIYAVRLRPHTDTCQPLTSNHSAWCMVCYYWSDNLIKVL